MSRNGFVPIIIALIVAAVLATSVGIWYYSKKSPPSATTPTTNTQIESKTPQEYLREGYSQLDPFFKRYIPDQYGDITLDSFSSSTSRDTYRYVTTLNGYEKIMFTDNYRAFYGVGGGQIGNELIHLELDRSKKEDFQANKAAFERIVTDTKELYPNAKLSTNVNGAYTYYLVGNPDELNHMGVKNNGDEIIERAVILAQNDSTIITLYFLNQFWALSPTSASHFMVNTPEQYIEFRDAFIKWYLSRLATD